MEHTYWLRQTATKPLFPDIEWSKPVNKDQAGKLLVVGGNKLGFSAAAESYQVALETGVGEAKVLLPDCLKRSVPASLTDVIFAACNQSGGLNAEAKQELTAAANWANGVLLIGDAGRNSETAVLYEQFIQDYEGMLTVTRDAIDLVRANSKIIVEREQTLIVASFLQLQKLFGAVYYPKILTFSMQLMQLVEALHKFTITYPCTVMTLHNDTIVIAHGGEVATQPWDNPMTLWKGTAATRAASYWLWSPQHSLQSSAASLL